MNDAQVICEDLQVGWIHFGTEVSHTCHGMGKELIKRKQIRQLYLHLGRIPEEEAQVIKVWQRAKAFFLMHRVMWKRNGDQPPLQVVLSKELRERIMKDAHDGSGHHGRDLTFRKIRDSYWWPPIVILVINVR